MNDEAFVRALHERTDGLPLFVASIMSEMSARAAQGGGRVATEQVAKIAVPENLAAIIEHYIAKLENEQRTVLSAAAVCGVQFRVNTIAAALERDAAWVGDICDQLAREQLWLVAPRAEEGGDDGRVAVFVQARAVPPSAVRAHVTIGARTASPENGRCAGTRARRTACRSARPSSPRISSEAATRRPPFATTPKPPMPLSPTSALKSACGSSSARCRCSSRRPMVPSATTLQITVATLHGLAATRVLGAGSEAKSAFQRAYSLLDEAPQHPMRSRLLHGFGFMLSLRGEYAEALAVADRAEALGSITNDPALLSTACTVHGQVDQLQGRPQAARTWLERGLALSERMDVGPGEFLVDPQVALLGMLAVPLLHLGSVEHAGSCVQRALSRARDRKWPMARLVAIWYSALFEVRLGNTERVAALADEMHALVDEFALAHGRTAWRWFHGWADARKGAPHEGYRRIRDAYEENTRLGMLAGASEILGYATEALLLAGDLDGAQKQLEEALHIADKLGERVYLPQLYLLEAAIGRARGERTTAAALGSARDCRGQNAGGAVARAGRTDRALRTRARDATGPKRTGCARRAAS